MTHKARSTHIEKTVTDDLFTVKRLFLIRNISPHNRHLAKSIYDLLQSLHEQTRHPHFMAHRHYTNITFFKNIYDQSVHVSGPRYYDFMLESCFVGRGIRLTGWTGAEDA